MLVTRLLGRTTIALALAVSPAYAQEIDDEPTPADTVTEGEALSFNSQLQWAEGNGDADDAYSVVLNLAYDVVPGLTVTPEVQWLSDTGGETAFGGVLRAQASF